MSKTPESLTLEMQRFAAELRRLEHRLKSETAPDSVALNEFRHAVDNVRMTAWSVSELVNAERIKKDPNAVVSFLSAERVRRFDHLVKNLCGDLERGLITVKTTGMQALCESVNTLQQRLTEALKPRPWSYKVKDTVS